MSFHPPTQELLDLKRKRLTDVKACAESLLIERRAQGVEDLDTADSIRFRSMMADVMALTAEIEEYRHDLERSVIPPQYQNLGGGGRRHGSAAVVAPLSFDQEQLRSAHGKLSRGETAILEARAFTSASPLLPAQLYGIPTFPRHENRLVDRLPGIALDVPSLEYVQVSTVSGAAAIVGEGQPKPEVTMPPTPLVCTAKKLAVHAGISWESWSDYEAFTQAVQNELIGLIVDLENAELWGGTPATGLNSLTKTAGILTLAGTGGAATPPNSWDDIALGIAKLRTGPALATPDLLLVHPDSWAAIRTQKDTLGRYVSGSDPTETGVQTAWGVEVLQSTGFAEGEAVLLDSTLVGRIAVRETITMRLGYSGDDLVRNVLRVVVEERLNFAIERPAAICHITGLPTSEASGTSRKSKAAA